MTIDTMKLLINDYSIEDNNNLTVQPASYIAGSGEITSEFPLFKDSSGRFFKGSKAYFNNDTLNMTIQPFTRSDRGTACFVSFSVPKVHNGNNYYSVGEAGSQAVVKKVEKELWNNGFHTDLNEASISRIDTFKNIQAEEPFTSYSNLFTLLKARRAQQRDYGTTFLVHNTQQEFCIYDKIAEMHNKGLDTSSYPENTIRFEHRLLNKKKVGAVLGFSSVSALFSGGYSQLKERQVNEWNKSLFSYSVEEVLVLSSKELEVEMLYFKNKFERNWFDYFLKAYGAYYLAEFAGVEAVERALSNLETETRKVWRAKKVLEDTKREVDFLKQAKGTRKTVADLYKELQYKVCSN